MKLGAKLKIDRAAPTAASLEATSRLVMRRKARTSPRAFSTAMAAPATSWSGSQRHGPAAFKEKC